MVKLMLKIKQAEKLKSRKMKEGWMKNDEGWMKNDKVWMKNDEGWKKNDEGWKKNDEGWWFQAVEGFCFRMDKRTNERTDICNCRVAFATQNEKYSQFQISEENLFIVVNKQFFLIFFNCVIWFNWGWFKQWLWSSQYHHQPVNN